MSRWIKLHTQALDHHMFDGDLMRLGAWIKLIGMAAWKPTTVKVNGKKIELQRGQLCASVRFLAKNWGVSKAWVQRYTSQLKTDTMIDTDSGTGILIITICNYDIYQGSSEISGTPTGTQSGTLPVHQPVQNKEVEYIELVEDIDTSIGDRAFDFDEPAPSSAKPASDKKYAFRGKVIRLTERDFEKWKRVYHAIPDLLAELEGLDDFYARQPAEQTGNWFFRAKQALNKKHQGFVATAKAKGATGPLGLPPPIDYAAMLKKQREQDEADDRERLRLMADDDA